MAATTISRATWTDGVSGTLINNARLQADVYDKIDSLLAGAITFGSTITAEGFGTHSFSAGGTGSNVLRIRNTSAGTTNFAVLDVGNDGLANAMQVGHTSSTYTTAGAFVQDGAFLNAGRVGGLSLIANNASGVIRFYTAGTNAANERMRVDASGNVGIGTTSASQALTITRTAATAAYAAFYSGSNYTLCGTGGGGEAIFGSFTNFNVLFYQNGSNRAIIDTSGHFTPGADDTYNLGSASLAWNRLFTANGSAASPAITAGNDTNTGIFFDGSDTIRFSTGGVERVTITSGGALAVSGALSVTGHGNCAGLLPNSDDFYDLGGVSDRWDDVYATNGTIQTSDRTLKTDIAALPLGLSFLRGLRPVQYRWNRADRKGTGRLHAGFIAQEVLAAAQDVAGYGLVTGDGTEANRYGLRYTELIAPLVAAVQELAARLEAVETR
jgi:hypothetical protein